MKVKIKNQTLPNGWYFELDRVPAFVGTVMAKITNSNHLIAGFIDPNYIRSDIFLVAKGTVWIKRFTGWRGQGDIYCEISQEEAIEWLKENGFLSNEESFDLQSLLSKAVKVECPPSMIPRTLSIRPLAPEEPPRFLDGIGSGAKTIPWPSKFHEL